MPSLASKYTSSLIDLYNGLGNEYQYYICGTAMLNNVHGEIVVNIIGLIILLDIPFVHISLNIYIGFNLCIFLPWCECQQQTND